MYPVHRPVHTGMMQITDTIIVLPALYVLANVVAFIGYAHDKRAAERGAWRTKESTLLLAAILGPFGAYAAMQRLRHKTQKMKFRLVPVFAVVHVAVIAYLAVLLF